MEDNLTPLSDAEDFDQFKSIKADRAKVTAEPAGEKPPQTEEVIPVSAAASGTVEPTRQEEKTVPIEDQIKELRRTGKHAAANKLERQAGAEEADRKAAATLTELRKELDALKSRPSEPAKSEPAKPAVQAAPVDASDPEPKDSDAKYQVDNGYTQYLRDLGRWDARQERRKDEAVTREREHKAKAQKSFQETAKAHPDANDVIGKVVISQGVIDHAVQQLDNVAEVFYKVGSDPALLAKIQGLSPMDQWAELRIVAHSLSNPPAAQAAIPEKPKPAPVSKVAAPPRVLSGTSEPPKKSTADAADFEEFKRLKKSAA